MISFISSDNIPSKCFLKICATSLLYILDYWNMKEAREHEARKKRKRERDRNKKALTCWIKNLPGNFHGQIIDLFFSHMKVLETPCELISVSCILPTGWCTCSDDGLGKVLITHMALWLSVGY